MDCEHFKFWLIFVLSLCFFTHSFSASTILSEGIFESQHASGRTLLQAKKPCPVNFEFMNYTIITSQCKGPQYPAKLCCPALKEFACPYSEQLNDLSNDCASTMFSYINLYGKYPPGLFANECKEDKIGLECPEAAPSQSAEDKSSQIMSNPSFKMMLTAILLVFLLQSP